MSGSDLGVEFSSSLSVGGLVVAKPSTVLVLHMVAVPPCFQECEG